MLETNIPLIAMAGVVVLLCGAIGYWTLRSRDK